ncbi:hypothetical protein EDC96DRAFT_586406 [Choanephora cucurbitarum]|nr:hypothetical protein EDC96DRAFT_586406 [Choanephora cucurbitarum]
MQLCLLLLLFISLLVYQVTALPICKRSQKLCRAGDLARKRSLPEDNGTNPTSETQQAKSENDQSESVMATGTVSVKPDWESNQNVHALVSSTLTEDTLVSCDEDVEEEEFRDSEQDPDDNEPLRSEKGVKPEE